MSRGMEVVVARPAVWAARAPASTSTASTARDCSAVVTEELLHVHSSHTQERCMCGERGRTHETGAKGRSHAAGSVRAGQIMLGRHTPTHLAFGRTSVVFETTAVSMVGR